LDIHPHLIDRTLYLGQKTPIGGTAHQAGTIDSAPTRKPLLTFMPLDTARLFRATGETEPVKARSRRANIPRVRLANRACCVQRLRVLADGIR
jgi:hypothetical protein